MKFKTNDIVAWHANRKAYYYKICLIINSRFYRILNIVDGETYTADIVTVDNFSHLVTDEVLLLKLNKILVFK